MILIRQAAPYSVRSAGAGACYLLTNHAARRDVFFQGDDATQFETELEAMELTRPNAPTSAILAELWTLYADVSAPIHEGV